MMLIPFIIFVVRILLDGISDSITIVIVSDYIFTTEVYVYGGIKEIRFGNVFLFIISIVIISISSSFSLHFSPILSPFYSIMVNLNIGTTIKNYFIKTPLEVWDYNSFSNFMEILGYEDDKSISKNYIKTLKYVIDNDVEVCKREMAENLLNDFKRSRNVVTVSLILFLF